MTTTHPSLPDDVSELPRPLAWVVSALARAMSTGHALAVVGALVLELARRRAGLPDPVAWPEPTADQTVTGRYVNAVRSTMTLPPTHGMQILIADDLDGAIAHLVAFGAANALAAAEPGAWASTTARIDELAETVADARIAAAMRWLDDERIELVRRPS